MSEPLGAAARVTRRDAVALLGGAAALALEACGGGSEGVKPPEPEGRGDIDILRYALTLEYLESDFYNLVIDSGVLTDPKIARVARQIRENEQEHVDALTQTLQQLGGEPPPQPATNFDPVIDGGQRKVLETAADIENLGAAAYLGQAGRIQSGEVLGAALSIHATEGRHAATLNAALGRPITPDGAFAKPATMKYVLEQVQPFLA